MPSLTVIIPALNEERNLAPTVEGLAPHLQQHFSDHEVLIYDDGSSDGTGRVADELARKNPRVRAIHNPRPMGLGYNYKEGVKRSAKDYVLMVPGDHDILEETFDPMFREVGRADVVLAYTGNMGIRPLGRVILSRAFTGLMNLLFGMNLKYFNGIVVHRRDLIQSVRIETDSFAYQAEALIKLLKQGKTYVEVPQYIRARDYGSSKALHPRNVARVLKAVAQLVRQIHFRG